MEKIEIKSFCELSNKELYGIMQLRNRVFIVEQCCPYLDLDGNDINAKHVFLKMGDRVVAYCRILQRGTVFPTVAIGRLVTDSDNRMKGYADSIMKKTMEHILVEMKETEIMLSAQTYITGFYENLGFTCVSDTYLEDNIPHRDMLYKVCDKSL